jgi:hypothetical protein
MNNTVTDRLQQIITEAERDVPAVLESIDDEFNNRKDMIVPNNKLEVHHVGGRVSVLTDASPDPLKLTPFSETQLFNHFGIPRTYADRLVSWDMESLIGENFRQINERHFKGKSVFIREVNGTIKGWLSPSYKRIDAKPIMRQFVDSAQRNGMLPVKAFNTDSRMQLRFISPEIITPAMNERESCIIGISLTTSDYGGSAFRIEVYFIRLVCLNGMIGASLFKQIHLGSRFQDWGQIVNLSKQTLDMDNAAMVSGIHDVIGSLQTIKIRTKESIEKAMLEAPPNSSWLSINKALDKQTAEDIKKIYHNSTDIMELPEEKTTWRLANAISFVAKQQQDQDKKIDMENLAMKLIA